MGTLAHYEAVRVIRKYFAPLSIIYDLLMHMGQQELAGVDGDYCFLFHGLNSPATLLRKEIGILVSAARKRQSVWSIKDVTALVLLAHSASRIDRRNSDEELPDACRRIYEVLKVKYVRSLLIIHRTGLPQMILAKVRDFLPTWAAFYDVDAPRAVLNLDLRKALPFSAFEIKATNASERL